MKPITKNKKKKKATAAAATNQCVPVALVFIYDARTSQVYID